MKWRPINPDDMGKRLVKASTTCKKSIRPSEAGVDRPVASGNAGSADEEVLPPTELEPLVEAPDAAMSAPGPAICGKALCTS